MKKISFLIYLFVLSTVVSGKDINTSNYASLKDGTVLYYEESGAGQPIIFIPGWQCSHEFFNKQLSYFNKTNRVITFDPRGQGLSPATLDHNNYIQHGKDLASFIDELKLKQVILVAWSFGCFDAYAYIRLHGVNNIKAFVCIDASPKASGNDGEWKSRVSKHNGADIMQQMEQNRYEFSRVWVQSMVERKLTHEELNMVVNETLRTPSYVAMLLLFDALNSDYRKEAILLDKSSVPTLNIVSKPMASTAEPWLKINTPHSKIITSWQKHMMFWEHADEFNKELANFIATIPSDKKM